MGVSEASGPDDHLKAENESLRRLLRAIVYQQPSHQVAVPQDYPTRDYGGALLIEHQLDEVWVTMTCVDGHEPDDPAPWRDVVCRVCGEVLEQARSPRP